MSPTASPSVSPTVAAAPTTGAPTTASPTPYPTAKPTAFPTTKAPTIAPTTGAPTTAAPTTVAPTTVAPTDAPTAPWIPRQALDGGRGDNPATTCITDPQETQAHGVTIAAQCCDPSDTSFNDGCRRYVDSTNNDEGCIGGNPPRPYTFAQAEALCDAAGLIMCDRNCHTHGCAYNSEIVWTSLQCSASPTASPSASPTTAAPTTASPSEWCVSDASWLSSTAGSCAYYVESGWCADGTYGPAWGAPWGTFEDYAVDGVHAGMVCCECGGGDRAPTRTPSASPSTASPTVS